MDTPDLSRPRCPVCEPEETIDTRVDFTRTVYCAAHVAPPLPGDADEQVTVTNEYLSGSGEMIPHVNRAFQALITRRASTS